LVAGSEELAAHDIDDPVLDKRFFIKLVTNWRTFFV
jgi:hypothetical protein